MFVYKAARPSIYVVSMLTSIGSKSSFAMPINAVVPAYPNVASIVKANWTRYTGIRADFFIKKYFPVPRTGLNNIVHFFLNRSRSRGSSLFFRSERLGSCKVKFETILRTTLFPSEELRQFFFSMLDHAILAWPPYSTYLYRFVLEVGRTWTVGDPRMRKKTQMRIRKWNWKRYIVPTHQFIEPSSNKYGEKWR